MEQQMRCTNNHGNDCISDKPCCERGYSINSLYQYIPHSCNPNIKSMKTEGCKEIWYALQPIAKGETVSCFCYFWIIYKNDVHLRCI